MSMLKGWKPISIKSLTPKKVETTPTPAMNLVEQVKPAENQMSKFRGTERKLAHFRNLFKASKDSIN